MRKFFSTLFLLTLMLGFTACSITGEDPMEELVLKEGGGSGGDDDPAPPPPIGNNN